MREHSASNPESGVRIAQPIGLGDHLRNCLRKKKNKIKHIINTQTKAVTQEPLLKKMSTQSSRAQLVFHRDHTTPRNNTRQFDKYQPRPNEKNNGPKWSFLTYDSQNNTHPVTHEIRRTEVLKKCWQRYQINKQQRSNHNNPNKNDKKTVTIMTYRKYHCAENNYRYRSEIKSKTFGL